jgi:hypothetical protein
MDISNDYATLVETGEIHAKGRALKDELGYTSDDERRQWREEVVAPWWAAMVTRAASDGIEVECNIWRDNSHSLMYAWPVVRRSARTGREGERGRISMRLRSFYWGHLYPHLLGLKRR